MEHQLADKCLEKRNSSYLQYDQISCTKHFSISQNVPHLEHNTCPHDIWLLFRLTSVPLKPFEAFHYSVEQCSTFDFKASPQTVLAWNKDIAQSALWEKNALVQYSMPNMHQLLCSPKIWFTFSAFNQLLQILNHELKSKRVCMVGCAVEHYGVVLLISKKVLHLNYKNRKT